MTIFAISEEQRAILSKIAEISGEDVSVCMQCGTCSGICPMAVSTRAKPRRSMLLLQRGLVHDVLDSDMPWLCASCHSCEVSCPRGIDIPKVMEALRQLQLRDRQDQLDPRDVPGDELRDMPQIALVTGFRKLTG
jgi:heterodisulfide reductase subunit C